MIRKFSTLKMLVVSVMVMLGLSLNAQCPTANVTITHPAAAGTNTNSTAAVCASVFSTNYVDNGGAAGAYTNGQNSIQTICPTNLTCSSCNPFTSPVGLKVKAVFTQFATENNWDYFYVHDGPTTASPLVPGGAAGASIGGFPAGGFTGATVPGGAAGVKSTDASGCLTFRFRSDASVNAAGWNATITNELATAVNGSFCPVDPEPCALACPASQNVSLTGCAGFTIPANLVTFTGNCPPFINTVITGQTLGFNGPLACAAATLYPAQTNSLTSCTPTTVTLANCNSISNNCNLLFFGTTYGWVMPSDGQICFDYVSSTTGAALQSFFGYSTTNSPAAVQTLGQIQGSTTTVTSATGVSAGSVCVNITAGARFSLTNYSPAANVLRTTQVSNIRYTTSVTTVTCPRVVQIAGPTAGTVVGTGVHNMKFEGFDGAGNFIGKCAFQITVTAQQPNLTCNDHVNVSVNQSCQVALVPDMLLENYEALLAAGCTAASFDIRVWPFNNQAAATGNVNGVATTFPRGTHTYEIRHPYGQKCWGTFTVEDKLAPVINCGPIRTIQCFEVDAFMAEDVTKKATPATARFAPTWADNCGASTAEFFTVKNVNGCEGGTIARSWVVTDAAGNTAACVQHFAVVRDFEWFCPAPLVVLNCGEETSASYIAATLGVDFAYPHVAIGANLVRVDGVCNLFSTVTDTEIDACAPGCAGNKKVIREWKVLDWCSGGITNCTQIIKSVDLDGPTLITKDTTVSTAPWYCEGDFFVPNPWELHDNCDANPRWTVRSTNPAVQIVPALLNGAPHPTFKFRAVGAPKGATTFIYTATDCCGNESSFTSTVTVVDRTPPVPVVKRDIVIGLVPGYDADGNQDGQAKLYCGSIDNGSYDNCSPIRCEIRRPAGSPHCGNLGNGNPRHNNNVTFNNRLAANLANNMPYNANDTDGGEFVKFCCADLTTAGADFDGDGTNDEGYHQVIMRVWDDGNMDGIIGNAGDNWNESWANVKVECKVPPTIVCPPNAAIACDWPIETFPSASATKSVVGVDFSKTGLPTAYGVCTDLPIQFRDRVELNQCGQGLITRTFIINEKGISRQCVQLIEVGPSTSQQQWETNFPSDWADVASTSCDGPSAADIAAAGPSNTGGPCDVIGTNTSIRKYEFEQGVCAKWIVTYNYTNWCTNETRGGFEKTFMYRDTEAPVIACSDAMYGVDNDCVYNGTLTKSATDNGGCASANPDRWLKWTVFVDLWADGTNDFEYTSFLPAGNDVNNMNSGNWGAIQDDNGNGVPDIYLTPTKDGASVAGLRLPTIEGKMSNHKVVWKVTDGCHNFASCSESFMVADKKAPTPVCVPLTTALMADPDGSGPLVPMVELWANDFMNKSYDNCTPENMLLTTFENVAPQIENKVLAGAAPNVINVNVDHYFDETGGLAPYPIRPNNASDKAVELRYLRGEGVQKWIAQSRTSGKVWASTSLQGGTKLDVDVKVTVWDMKFNSDYCWTTLSLINNTTPGSGSKVSGNVATAGGQGLSNVSIVINGAGTEYPKTATTSNGAYLFDLSNMNGNYELAANKSGDYLNGVSTLDLVMIQRHILGVATLDSPYKIIAADATNDGKVTGQDLTELRKLILGITTELPANASWRFPVVNQTMGSNPFPFVEKLTVSGEATAQDFVAVKIGDVNGNVVVNANGDVTEARSNTNIAFEVAEATLTAGETVEIPVTASNFNEVFGYQFTLATSGVSLVDVKSGALNVDANNVGKLANGVVTMSYASNVATTASADEVLFTLVVKADKSVNVSNALTMNSTVTAAESYVGNEMKVGKASLNVRTAPVAGIEMFQNEPNPFKDFTVVNYNMPEAAAVTITVTDITGKVISVKNVEAAKGMNQERFTKSQLAITGVLFYTLTSGEFTATKKMIIVE